MDQHRSLLHPASLEKAANNYHTFQNLQISSRNGKAMIINKSNLTTFGKVI